MSKTFDKIYEILGSKQFYDYLENMKESLNGLDIDDFKAIENLLHHIHNEKPNVELNSIYLSIMHVIQLYLRPTHPEGVFSIKTEFEGLFREHLKRRFISGSEGIAEICMCHGEDFECLFDLSEHADGIIGDDFHPRFIAAMIRLGDLLDLDNDRFPEWFLKEALKSDSIISDLSILHARKHEAITHILITDEKIDIEASCNSRDSGYETARLVSHWTDALVEECQKLVLHWSKIAQPDFGLAPGNVNIKILVDKKEYSSVNKVLQMQMPQERVMNLLKGTSIYQNQYVGIRELIQNAVDASLIQLWEDIKQNRYKSYGLSKDSVRRSSLTLKEFAKIEKSYEIFKNYDITVELIKNLDKKRVEVVIKDRGAGISKEDVKYIAEIGYSEKNMARKTLKEGMPEWLRPSGIFGIGLQSVFQITDCLEFYTRQPNQPERKIALYSYDGTNRGRLEVSEVPPNTDGLYYDNAIPGTNAKIIINKDKVLHGVTTNKKPVDNQLMHYDLEFDTGDELDILYAEICMACEAIIKETRRDYFNIEVQKLEILEEDIEGKTNVTERKSGRVCYFSDNNIGKKRFGYSGYPLFTQNKNADNLDRMCIFRNHIAFYWDDENNRAYRLEVRPCTIKNRNGYKQVYLPQKIQNLYRVSYKFNKISQSDSIYSYNDTAKHSHAGFLMWDIQILDGNPTKYLNIDRDRLRTGAIKEEELLQVRNRVLEEWCRYLIDRGLRGLQSRKKSESKLHSGKEDSNKASNINLLSEKQRAYNYTDANLEHNSYGIDMALSFIFLFFQNVDEGLFQKYYEVYRELQNWDFSNIYIEDKQIPIEKIWDNEVVFYSFQTFLGEPVDRSIPNDTVLKAYNPDCSSKELKDETELIKTTVEKTYSYRISLDAVKHFPHRLVHPEKIVLVEDKLQYCFRFNEAKDNTDKIDMDDGARGIDYTLSMQMEDSGTKNFPFYNIQKTVFRAC